MAMSTQSNESIHRLAGGKLVRVTTEEIQDEKLTADAAEREQTESGTWPALLAAALEAKRQGRRAFYQAIHGTRANPGWQKEVRSDDWKLRKLLDKVEKMSSLGKMEQEVEILGALSPEQRSAHVVEKRARGKRARTPHVGATRHSDTDEDRTSWKQLYEETQRELHQLRQENEELLEAVGIGQELETENATLRSLCAGLESENDALRKQRCCRSIECDSSSSSSECDSSSK